MARGALHFRLYVVTIVIGVAKKTRFREYAKIRNDFFWTKRLTAKNAEKTLRAQSYFGGVSLCELCAYFVFFAVKLFYYKLCIVSSVFFN